MNTQTQTEAPTAQHSTAQAQEFDALTAHVLNGRTVDSLHPLANRKGVQIAISDILYNSIGDDLGDISEARELILATVTYLFKLFDKAGLTADELANNKIPYSLANELYVMFDQAGGLLTMPDTCYHWQELIEINITSLTRSKQSVETRLAVVEAVVFTAYDFFIL